MNLRNLDGSTEIKLKENSHKKILFECDMCDVTVEQEYRTYLKQKDGKFCRKCRNKHTANRIDVKEKQSKKSIERWKNPDFRDAVIKGVSDARKREWAEGKRKISNKTKYEDVKSIIEKDNYILNTSKEEYEIKGNKISITCPNGHTFDTFYTRFKNGHRCQECRKADYDKIYNSFNDDGYILLTKKEEYINNNQKLDYICPKGTKHSITWCNWQLGHRCPCCNTGMSKAEKEIGDYLETIGLNIIRKDRDIIKPLELDIVIPDKKIAIEYCGLYYHGFVKLGDKNYHLKKLNMCNENGYRLITIFEDEWLYKKDIVKSRLKHILINTNGIYARKCIIKEIETKEAKLFIDTYHIQGYTSCSIKFGAFYNDELVACFTMSKGSISKGNKAIDGIWELSRFCCSVPVVGIVSKFMRYFEVNYKPKEIFTYADRRWSEGNLYKSIGMEFVSFSQPNYFYFNTDKMRKHRFNFRKDKIKHLATSEIQTEWEIMKEQGWDKIYDCGNYKFVKKYINLPQ